MNFKPMKTILSCCLIVLHCSFLLSQVQNGIVRELNSNRRPISGVEIFFESAVPTISDDDGKFRLAFSGKQPGDIIFLDKVFKLGFEVVNKTELQSLQISNTRNLSVDIIMAKEGVVDAAKKEYYEVSDIALLRSFNKKKKELQQKIQQEEITQQEYIDKIALLQEQYDNQKKSLDALAEKFARVNFDDVSDVYREALELFKAGLVEEAIAKLEEADFLNRSALHIKERDRITEARKQLQREKEENEKGTQEDIKAMLQLAKEYTREGKTDEAEKYYEQLLQLDSTSLSVLYDSTVFFISKTKQTGRTLDLLNQIKNHPEASEKEVLDAIQMIMLIKFKNP